MAKTEEKQIQQSVHVDCPIEEAFRLFTEEMTEWWPEKGVDHCEIEPWVGGRVFERSRSGEEREWGTVIEWDAPRRVEFMWYPEQSRDDDQTVAVEFRVEGEGTRVTLTHRGWDRAGVAVCFAGFVSERMLVAI